MNIEAPVSLVLPVDVDCNIQHYCQTQRLIQQMLAGTAKPAEILEAAAAVEGVEIDVYIDESVEAMEDAVRRNPVTW